MDTGCDVQRRRQSLSEFFVFVSLFGIYHVLFFFAKFDPFSGLILTEKLKKKNVRKHHRLVLVLRGRCPVSRARIVKSWLAPLKNTAVSIIMHGLVETFD